MRKNRKEIMITRPAYFSLLLLHCYTGVNLLKTDKFCVLHSSMANLNCQGSGSAPVPVPLAAFHHTQASERSQNSHGVISTGKTRNLFTKEYFLMNQSVKLREMFRPRSLEESEISYFYRNQKGMDFLLLIMTSL